MFNLLYRFIVFFPRYLTRRGLHILTRKTTAFPLKLLIEKRAMGQKKDAGVTAEGRPGGKKAKNGEKNECETYTHGQSVPCEYLLHDKTTTPHCGRLGKCIKRFSTSYVQCQPHHKVLIHCANTTNLTTVWTLQYPQNGTPGHV